MTELAVALAAITALIVAFLIGRLSLRGGETAVSPAEKDALPATTGALVPDSPPRARSLRNLAKDRLERLPLERLPEATNANAALVIDTSDRLGSELRLARTNGTLDTIKGPAAAALASLLGNEQIMNTVLGKASYYIVKASPGAKWMSANGVKVAQEVGPLGAGTRAVVVGGAAFTMPPVLAGVALEAVAQYILTAKIERVGKVAGLLHDRQLAEALSTSDHVYQLIGRLREYDDPRDWPEVLIVPLVDAHHDLSRQTFAADRLRDLILGNDPDEKQPADRRWVTGRARSTNSLRATSYTPSRHRPRRLGWFMHTRMVTRSRRLNFEWQLQNHIGQLRAHHEQIDAISNMKVSAVQAEVGASPHRSAGDARCDHRPRRGERVPVRPRAGRPETRDACASPCVGRERPGRPCHRGDGAGAAVTTPVTVNP